MNARAIEDRSSVGSSSPHSTPLNREKPIKVLVADEFDLFREGLIGLLEDQPEIHIVGEACLLSELAMKSLELVPDVILTDLEFRDGSVYGVMQTVLARHPEIAIVILTEREDSESLTNAFIFGARGFLLKNTTKQKLMASLRAVMRGEPALTRAMVGKVLAVLARVGKMIHEQPPETSLLTYREEQVLKHLANALSNREVADTLGISENTVRVHVRNILSKLQLRSRQEAGDYARRMGITFTIQTITRNHLP